MQWVGVLKEINADASFDVEGSFSSALGRAWLDIKASLQMINDEVLLSAIEDSYEEIKQPYENLEIRHKKMDFLGSQRSNAFPNRSNEFPNRLSMVQDTLST